VIICNRNRPTPDDSPDATVFRPTIRPTCRQAGYLGQCQKSKKEKLLIEPEAEL
jgi:hypothetical protein